MPDKPTYHPPRPDEAAWAAGIFEGEGSITIGKGGNPKDRLGFTQLAVKMNDEDVVKRFCEVVGCGTVYGPYRRPDRPSGREGTLFWDWKAGAQGDVVHVLSLFLPYFGLRRKARALEALASVTPRLHARIA